MTETNEAALFFRCASALSAARRSSDISRSQDAADELEVLAMYTSSTKLRDRALAAVSDHWLAVQPTNL
ncbi:hypothetical protein PhaeoP30_02851 [Phaeobacter inhibens]|nr:hypothetical protein PhaeoP30_02851 [Phaeobacter inhibens]